MKHTVHTAVKISHNTDQSTARYICQEIFSRLNTELNSTCHLLALLGAHHILHVSRKRVNNEHTFS